MRNFVRLPTFLEICFKNHNKPQLFREIQIFQIRIMSELKLDAVPTISLENPSDEYGALMSKHVTCDDVLDDDVVENNVKKISKAAQNVIWSLLFDKENAEQEALDKAAKLLIEYKGESSFYNPWFYNEWIPKVRDELLKRNSVNLKKFWSDVIVKNELGLCWARDSDYFDDLSDEEPEKFYNHGGCTARFAKKKSRKSDGEGDGDADVATSADTSEPAKTNEEKNVELTSIPKISLADPESEYKKLMDEHVKVSFVVDDDVLEGNVKKISKAVQTVIWDLLFEKETPEEEALGKAAELLRTFKAECCFYNPWLYNEWIPTVRDELLKRDNAEFKKFWSDVIVKDELGLCWYKDSDYFDDMSDKEPEQFYNYGGCTAPFKKE